MNEWTEGLNPHQLEAARNLEGPLLILAGAGSGKTKTMTHRIAHMVEEGVAPEKILAVTFTNKAAKEMAERIEGLVGKGAGIDALTFHSLGYRLLRSFYKEAGFSKRISISDEEESQKRLKASVLYAYGEDVEDASDLVKQCKKRMSACKNLLIRPSDVVVKCDEDSLFKRTYEDYQKRLLEDSAVDFDDLIAIPVLLMKENEGVRKLCREMYDYVCVDEYQDTSIAQSEMMKVLSERTRNICVVGDDYQSIYAFRGATIGNILSFPKDFPDCKTITLGENYRSTQNIVNAASEVISNNKKQFSKELVSQNEVGKKIRVACYSDSYQEAREVVSSISERTDAGESASEFAILYRNNSTSRLFEKELVRHGIPYRIFGGTNFYSRKEIKDALAYVKLAAGYENVELLERVFKAPKVKGLGAKSAEKALSFVKKEKGASLLDAISKCANECEPKLAELSSVLLELKKDFENSGSGAAFLQSVIEKARLEEAVAESAKGDKESYLDRMQNLSELCNAMREHSDLGCEEAVEALLEEASLMEEGGEKNGSTEAVSLMTEHKSKGLEFGKVYVVSAICTFPEEEAEEERRLFYVAMTRAKKELEISYPKMKNEFGKSQKTEPSPFVKEIPKCVKSFVDRTESSFCENDQRRSFCRRPFQLRDDFDYVC